MSLHRWLVLSAALTLVVSGFPAPAAVTARSTTALVVGPQDPAVSAASDYHAQWSGQSAYSELLPNAEGELWVKFKNVGTKAWRDGVAGETARIGTWGPIPGQDQPSVFATGASAPWPAPNRPAAQSPATVNPGEVGEFKFVIHAPADPGIYFLFVRPVIEGTTWLEDYGVYWKITVLKPDGSAPCTTTHADLPTPGAFTGPPTPGFHARWAGQSGYPKLCPGDQTTIRVNFHNSGGETWPAGLTRIGTWWPEPGADRPTPLGGTWLGWPNWDRPAIAKNTSGAIAPIPSGGTGVFDLKIQAPVQPGVYWLHVRPVVDGVAWMEDWGVYWKIVVTKGDGEPACKKTDGAAIGPEPATPPPSRGSGYHASWAGQSGYPVLCPGDEGTFAVRFYNSGDTTWPAGTTRLGPWFPEPGQDRPSLLGGPWLGWPLQDRTAQTLSAVAPGGYAVFEFAVRAPRVAGFYYLFVRPVVDGATWMEDWGVFLKVKVLQGDGSEPRVECGSACWPLFGTPVAGSNVGRRGLNVRIDNAGAARPHYGISQADMMFETLIDSFNITRLHAILHSQDPATIGSVRSARLVDHYLTPMTRGGLGYAGSTIDEYLQFKRDAEAGLFLDLSFNSICGSSSCGDFYYRVGFRGSPYNLFTSAGGLRQAMARAITHTPCSYCVEPVSIAHWAFLAQGVEHAPLAGGMLGSSGATGVTIPYPSGSYTVRYQYDAGSHTYLRFQGGALEVDAANGARVAPRNIVVIHTDIWFTNIIEDIHGSRGLDMCIAKGQPLTGGGPVTCSGTGHATIFRDGRRQDGTWSRESMQAAFTFTNVYGEKILLESGQTWVHVLPRNWSVPSN